MSRRLKLTQIKNPDDDFYDSGEESQRESVDDAAAGVVKREERVGSRRADGRLLTGAQDAVDESGNERRVQTVLKMYFKKGLSVER